MRKSILIVGLALMCQACATEYMSLAPTRHWSIVVSEDAIESEKYAAAEFQRLFEQATGRRLPIRSQQVGKAGNVLIGGGRAVYAPEELDIRIANDHIAIAGGRPRGVLYGVYEFFERYLGVRYLTHDHTHVPAAGKITHIPCERYRYNPPFAFRTTSYREASNHPEFSARLRNNRVTGAAKLGGTTTQPVIGHSFGSLFPAGTYYDDHPEYFALVEGERLRISNGPEPDSTNPEVISIITSRAMRPLESGRKHSVVSPNDNDGFCRCRRCEAIDGPAGTPMGAHLTLVNAVAKHSAKLYPDAKVGTLAYWYTRHCPKTVRPRKNVEIQLCNIECCILHPIQDPTCPRNRDFYKDLKDWTSVSKQVWGWTYNTNFDRIDLPFPNLRAIGPDLKLYAKRGVRGVYMTGNGSSVSGEMSDLRNYVMSRCLWHPGLDSWEMALEFCRLHYQEAAGPIIRYLTELHDDADRNGHHPYCQYTTADQVGLTPATARRAFGRFQEALSLAQDPKVRERVEKASICVYRGLIDGGEWLTYDNGVYRIEFPPEYEDVIDRYLELCKRFNLTSVGEGGHTPQSYADEVKKYVAGVTATVIENEVWQVSILPEQNGKVIGLYHKPSDRHLFRAVRRSTPSPGTHEELGILGHYPRGPLRYSAEVDGQRATLLAEFDDGSTMTREIWLDLEDPGKVFFKTTIQQRGDAPRTYYVQVHPEFDVSTYSADSNILRAYVLHDRWVQFNQGWKQFHGPNTHLLDDDEGGIAFFNDDENFGMAVRYDPEPIRSPRLWWNSAWSQANLELLSKRTRLNKGESLSYSYQFVYLSAPPG